VADYFWFYEHLFASLADVPGRINLTPSGIENLRRSVVMLTPRQASGLDREDAMVLLEEIQRLQRRCGDLQSGVLDALAELKAKVRRLMDDDNEP
jgi:hypothetical protein